MRLGPLIRIGAVLLLYGACQGNLFTIEIEESAVTTVEKGTLVENLLVDVGFGGFVAMDLTDAEEIRNQGVAPGDIRNVALTSFELEAASPSNGDLSFLDGMELYVESPGLPRVLVAWQDTFPAGVALVPFELEDVDLTDYVVSESMTLTTEVMGRRPDVDTQVEARFALDVGVTGQGACNQTKQQPDE